jgi:hypothetical protein
VNYLVHLLPWRFILFHGNFNNSFDFWKQRIFKPSFDHSQFNPADGLKSPMIFQVLLFLVYFVLSIELKIRENPRKK